jgi:hypothetical protein
VEVLDPGRTWTKEQLLVRLQGIVIKKANAVSVLYNELTDLLSLLSSLLTPKKKLHIVNWFQIL